MAQRCVRFSDSIEAEVANVVRRDGYASAAACVRTAVEHERKQRQAFLQSERELAATLEQHRNEIRRELKGVVAAINVQFAFLDAFARMMLHFLRPTSPFRTTSDALITSWRFQVDIESSETSGNKS